MPEKNYEIDIQFQPTDKGTRQPITGTIRRSQYKKIIAHHRQGRTHGTYQFIIDGVPSELTFPLAEIDIIYTVPEAIKHE